MPSEVEIVIPEPSPALEETVGEALTTLLRTEENIRRKDRDNELVRTDVGLISDGIDCLEVIPDCYIRPPSERPRLNEVAFADFIPVVDLDNFSVSARKRAISNIKDACQQYGFFQIVNHGVHETLIQRMLEVAREFFGMPAEHRADLRSEDPSRVVRLSSSFNIQEENVFNWRNYLRLHCYPLEDYIDYWPIKPSAYREVASKYCNGLYKCTILRAVVNSSVSRISIASFYCPSNDAMIEPVSSLIHPHNPARYGKFTYEEYYRKFWSKNLDGRTCLDLFSVNDANRLIKDQIIGQDLNPEFKFSGDFWNII